MSQIKTLGVVPSATTHPNNIPEEFNRQCHLIKMPSIFGVEKHLVLHPLK